ncbi:septum formation inhibitor Maf [Zobellella endophytica]|uniref:7-methyl-GTP pyrophosphatase n=1 Tax=Zobellella endophytica TaxID=2116700 RepID=A0A2P7RCB8_9GAMM|nr:septum formation inhibitor Maf [Zobellella endophytica]
MAAIILASSSRYRQQLLHKLGLDFDCTSPDIDESPRPGEGPQALVRRLAEQKARAVATGIPLGLIIGSDQACVNQGRILGKPGTRERARAQLLAASGRVVTFYTGLAVLDAASGELHSLVEPFAVHFRTLNETQVDRYLDREPALDCAGAFKCEGLGISLFERMDGRDPNSLVGLPLIGLVELLARFGVEVP